ncbi:MAG: (Fe-S)-binding protein [Chloroflexi bacterium]|nr:(Fe-S)-binding protein [Chloroflexota bacterium]MBU1750662.1 (Fe-S)-binding protein [Chloroflexota bacterium]
MSDRQAHQPKDLVLADSPSPACSRRGTRLDIAHLTGRQVLELLACTRCGECIAWCPTYAEAERDEITPLTKIATLRSFLLGQSLGAGPLGRLFGHRRPDEAGLARWAAGTYDCTLCGRCRVVCPVGIRTRELWIAMREQLVALDRHPALMDRLRETVDTYHNISGQPNAQRTGWSDNLERVLPSLDRQKGAEVVYFLGCVAAFYPMVYSIPRAMSQVMERAGVSWTTLGGDEWCCGFPLTIAGFGADAEALARHNVTAVRDLGARTVVTACPSCYHTWRHDYPRLVGDLGVQVMHSTELLRDLVRAGRVELRGFPDPITYHDPCDLGRTSGIYDAPREIIRAIPGVQFTEMRDHREYSLCCGGGGDVEMADAGLSQAVARRRLAQAQETGAQTIVTACQQCQRTLLGAARRKKTRIKTIDISELVLEAMRQA